MNLPRFCLIGLRPAALLPTPTGGMCGVALDWKSGAMVAAPELLDRLVLPSGDMDVVSAHAFDTAVAQLRLNRGLDPVGAIGEQVRQFAARITEAARAGEGVLLAASILTFEGRRRLGAMAIRDRRPVLLAEEFLDDAATADLLRALNGGLFATPRCAWPGRWDAMYATPWTLLWTTSQPLGVWNPKRRLLDGEGGRLRMHGQALDAVVAEAWVSRDWVMRGVRLRLADGDAVDLVRVQEPSAEVDPTYDRLDVSMDAAWASTLASDIARVAGLKLVDEIP